MSEPVEPAVPAASTASTSTTPQPTAPAASVGVVPVANLTGDASKEYFSDGMARFGELAARMQFVDYWKRYGRRHRDRAA